MAKKKITDLKFDDKNFNIGSQQGNALLEKSIQKFGFREAATVDKNGVLIGGNKRTAKAGELGFEDVEIIKADPKKVYALQYDDIDIDTPEGRSLALALNATAKSNIVLDAELVEAELGEAVCEEWGVETSKKLEAEEDDYEIPDTIETDIVLGDLFEIGRHRLLCGDSTDSDSVAKLMSNEVADLVFTDPPYGVNYQSGMREKGKRFDILLNDDQFITDWIHHLPIFSKGFVFVWTSWKVIDKWIEYCKPIGDLTNIIIWNKGGGGMGDLKGSFAVDYELALVYSRDAHITGKRIGSVWDVKRHNTNEYKHPTQKPVALAALAIENITTHRGLILDLFLGSGTTMVAAHQLNRKCYGMELDPKYCQVIIDRMLKLDPSLEIKKNGDPYTQPHA